jgi:hypothetical protein
MQKQLLNGCKDIKKKIGKFLPSFYGPRVAIYNSCPKDVSTQNEDFIRYLSRS